MSDAVYKTVHIIGSSPKGVEDAIEGAVARAAKTLDHLNWFEVKEIRGHIENGKVAHYQVGLEIGFRLN